MNASVQHLNIAEMLLEAEFTLVKNPGKDDMEIIRHSNLGLSCRKFAEVVFMLSLLGTWRRTCPTMSRFTYGERA